VTIVVQRENTIHTKDYFEFLNSIPTGSVTTKNYGFFGTKNEIILNPNFIDLNYEKSNKEQNYLRCASIKFFYNNKIYIICGSSHSDCFNKISDYFDTDIKNYQRGFLTNTNIFVRSEDVRSVIKNYKQNTKKITSLKQYKIIINDNFTVFDIKNNQLMEAHIIRKKTTRNAFSFIIKSKLLVEDKIKENIPKLWYIHLLKDMLIISEKDREFLFDKKLRIHFLLIDKSL
jgi:hypothetical protein